MAVVGVLVVVVAAAVVGTGSVRSALPALPPHRQCRSGVAALATEAEGETSVNALVVVVWQRRHLGRNRMEVVVALVVRRRRSIATENEVGAFLEQQERQ